METRQADGNRREPDYLEQGHAETAIGEPSGRGDNPALAVDVAQVVEGEVSVAVCRNGPLRAALRSQCPQSVREVVRAA
ncbi:MAG: hypothetical protein JXA67_02990 [Micromonosporaceae bacterium]|nr:hypothetical protein [Micromonosporaceae bacterium]